MPVYDFNQSFNEKDERFISMDEQPDFRTDIEQRHSPLAIYNHASADLAFAERTAFEVINLSGAWVTVFIKEPYVDHADVEGPWDEDADPLYRPGLNLKAFVKVNPYNFELTRWGVDAPLKLNVVFSRAQLLKEVGERLLNIGDVIEVPYNAPKFQGPARFRVLNAFDSGMFKYRWLYYNTAVELITGDKSLKVSHQQNSKIR